jgi:A/G-specific adenine glycosylase
MTMRDEMRVRRLLDWYDAHRRELPWRAQRGRPDPYRVWLSEIMLQQTTVAAVAGYYNKFVTRWPDVTALAKAPLDEVLGMWAGLGYYARARNLHACAKIVAGELDGCFPNTFEGLRALPGIGTYTAGAIAAIAYDLPFAAMDANAERVIARLFAVAEPLPGAKERLRALCQEMVPARRAGDFVQALMDLGAGICSSRRPGCEDCPWTDDCAGHRRGIAETLPIKAAKKNRPVRRGAAFVAVDAAGRVLLEKRPEKGLLGGMLQPPLGPWSADFPSTEEALRQAPFRAVWRKCPGLVRHTFTHFELQIEVYVVETNTAPPEDSGGAVSDCAKAFWYSSSKLSEAALPTVMRKILIHAGALFPALARHSVLPRKG